MPKCGKLVKSSPITMNDQPAYTLADFAAAHGITYAAAHKHWRAGHLSQAVKVHGVVLLHHLRWPDGVTRRRRARNSFRP